jgi:hypothetical protein
VDALIIEKFHPHFEPGQTDHFTIDTGNRLPLDDIVRVRIGMGRDEWADLGADYGTTWRPTRVQLEFNGRQVLDQTVRGQELTPGGELDLAYPPAPSEEGGLKG